MALNLSNSPTLSEEYNAGYYTRRRSSIRWIILPGLAGPNAPTSFAWAGSTAMGPTVYTGHAGPISLKRMLP